MNDIIVICQGLCHNGGMPVDDRVKINLAMSEEYQAFFKEVRQKTGMSPVDFVRLVVNMKSIDVAKMLGVDTSKFPTQDDIKDE